MNVLYINACVRPESRTHRLAQALLERFAHYDEVRLTDEDIKPLNYERLTKRTELAEKGDYSDDMFRHAKQFKEADIIVIGAPYWDLSFPAVLKIYVENLYVVGLVTEYGTDGRPNGLCRAQKLYYVTTAGGPYDPAYSYEYIQDLAVNHFAVKDTELIKADMLDIEGFDAEKIMSDVIEEVKKMEI